MTKDYVSVPEALRQVELALWNTEKGRALWADNQSTFLEHTTFVKVPAVLMESVALTWQLLGECRDPQIQCDNGLEPCPKEWLAPQWHPGDDRENNRCFDAAGEHIDLSLGIPGRTAGSRLTEDQKRQVYGHRSGQVFIRQADVEKLIKERIMQAAPRGRPRKADDVLAVYRRAFPKGHGTLSMKEVDRRLRDAGLTDVSFETVRRTLAGLRSQSEHG